MCNDANECVDVRIGASMPMYVCVHIDGVYLYVNARRGEGIFMYVCGYRYRICMYVCMYVCMYMDVYVK